MSRPTSAPEQALSDSATAAEPNCLLCGVAHGTLPGRVVVSNERCIALLNDAEPFATGHVVVFPRRHAARLEQLEEEELSAVMVLLKRTAAALGAANYNILQNNGSLAGQTVMHAHFHLIPKWSAGDGLRYERPTAQRFDQNEIYRTLRATLGKA